MYPYIGNMDKMWILKIDKALKFKFNEIYKMKTYFIKEIRERELLSKTLNKYIAVFDYVVQNLLVLLAASIIVSIISFASVIGVYVGTVSASVSLVVSYVNGFATEFLKSMRKNRAKVHSFH